jgi:hypothetical protein
VTECIRAHIFINLPEQYNTHLFYRITEKYLWNMIHKNWINQYETELSWIRQIRQELGEMEAARQWAKS